MGLDPNDPNYQPQPEPPPPPPPSQAARATALYTVTATPAKTMTYDANGNLVNDGERTYRWDAENRLVQIVGTYGRTDFEYDGLSRRVKLTERDQTGLNTLAERRFGWEGMAIAEERDANNDVVKRFWGLGETRRVSVNGQPSTLKLTYTRDHLGSVREMLDETCAIRARYAYDEWGKRTKLEGDLECDFGFTGHFEHAASGVTLSPYRGYRSDLGRWLSRDPIGEAGGMNLYRYVLNRVLSSVDPTGLISAESATLWGIKILGVAKKAVGEIGGVGPKGLGGGIASAGARLTGSMVDVARLGPGLTEVVIRVGQKNAEISAILNFDMDNPGGGGWTGGSGGRRGKKRGSLGDNGGLNRKAYDKKKNGPWRCSIYHTGRHDSNFDEPNYPDWYTPEWVTHPDHER